MADEIIYCGNGKSIKTQYGDLLKLSFSAEDIQKLQDNLENGWVNAVVKERREPSERGTTHYLQIDNWKPQPRDDQEENKPTPAPKVVDSGDEISPEDLPF